MFHRYRKSLNKVTSVHKIKIAPVVNIVRRRQSQKAEQNNVCLVYEKCPLPLSKQANVVKGWFKFQRLVPT